MAKRRHGKAYSQHNLQSGAGITLQLFFSAGDRRDIFFQLHVFFKMLSPKTKRNISRIIPFGVIWLVFSIVYSQLEKGLLGDLNYYPSTGNPYNFTRNIFITPIAALITGLFIGIIEILYFNKWFMQKSFSKKVVYKSIIYLAIILSFLLVLTVIANSIELQTAMFDEHVWNNVWAFFSIMPFGALQCIWPRSLLCRSFILK